MGLLLTSSLLLVALSSLILGVGVARGSLFDLLSTLLIVLILKELMVIDVERGVVLDELVVNFKSNLIRLAKSHDVRAHFLQELREGRLN